MRSCFCQWEPQVSDLSLELHQTSKQTLHPHTLALTVLPHLYVHHVGPLRGLAVCDGCSSLETEVILYSPRNVCLGIQLPQNSTVTELDISQCYNAVTSVRLLAKQYDHTQDSIQLKSILCDLCLLLHGVILNITFI